MSLNYGNPKNWWAPFFGHNMWANREKLSHRELAGEPSQDIRDEIEQWVQNCTKGLSIKVNPYCYRFLSKGDAMMFKLAWG